MALYMLVTTDQVIILWQCGTETDVSLKCKYKYDNIQKKQQFRTQN